MKKQMVQKDFAKEIGKSQAVLSRYESGETEPSLDVYMHCMHILNNDVMISSHEVVDEMTVEILIRTVKKKFKGPEMAKARQALSIFMDQF